MAAEKTCIVSPRWIAPVAPDNIIIEGHSLVISGQKIVDLKPSAEASAAYPDADVITLPDHLLMPGLVNVHGHAAMTLLRGYADDLEMMDWLTNCIWPIEAELVDAQFVYDGTRLAAAEMIRGGTTCAADTYFFPEAAARAFTDMKFRAQVAMPVLQFANAWARDEEDHIHKGLAFRDSIKNSDLITTAFAPHSPYTVSDAGFEKVRLYAEQLDLPVHLHLHETASEVADAVTESGTRPIARMQQLGIISASLQAVHMTQLRDDEIELLATNGVQVAHCPESNLKLASGLCPVQQLLDSGINVAIGTDGAASNNDLDMLQEARTASMLSKIVTTDATSLSANQALHMMTLGGAKFLGLDDKLGSLEAGKLADVIAVDMSDLSFQPMYNPVSHLVYTATAQHVSHVWINGELLLENKVLTQADSAEIRATTADWQSKISKIKNREADRKENHDVEKNAQA
jgi:5-methylthioadenosine/S-adenosylhomocysteine deaminase